MISPNNQNAQTQKVGRSSNKWSKCGHNFLVAYFKSSITVSIFIIISLMTTFWNSHDHFASNGIDLAEIWVVYQKITAPKARLLSKYAMNPGSRVWNLLDLLQCGTSSTMNASNPFSRWMSPQNRAWNYQKPPQEICGISQGEMSHRQAW